MTDVDTAHARRWLGLAVGVLILAGLFALLLVLARMPPFDRFVTDPDFFRRCLVVHVNLSLVLWFYSFIAALLFILPAHPRTGGLARASLPLGVLGVVMMGIAAWIPGSDAVMSNYIPMVDHWLFGTGIAVFGVGVLAVVFSRRLIPARTAERSWLRDAQPLFPGLRVTAIALVLAGLTFLAARMCMTDGLAAEVHYELLFWGGGHVLQLASTAAMLVVWLYLVGLIIRRPVLSVRTSSILFGLLVLPWLVAPLLAASGTSSTTYRLGFTHLMQFSIFPVVLIVLALCIKALVAQRREGLLSGKTPRKQGLDVRSTGFLASAMLTIAGFVLGAMIRGSNTIVPAHYHASIGAVTVAFMAGAFLLLEPLGLRVPGRRLSRLVPWQPLIYGGGQAVFAIGFAIAGSHGMARKAYGLEQADKTLLELVGMVTMGIGGFVAIAGGILFLLTLAAAGLHRTSDTAIPVLLDTRRSR